MKMFKLIGHTADMRARVTGTTLKQTFRSAAKGFIELVGAAGEHGRHFTLKFELKASSIGNLLIEFLNELNYIVTAKKAVITDVVIKDLQDNHISASVTGLKNIENIRYLREIKAATYNDIKIRKTSRGFEAVFTLDI